jgi:hypothetical protein
LKDGGFGSFYSLAAHGKEGSHDRMNHVLHHHILTEVLREERIKGKLLNVVIHKGIKLVPVIEFLPEG